MTHTNLNYKPYSANTKWTWTCRAFVTSCFLIHKHLVQNVQHAPPVFFLEVRRYREAPFWRIRTLKPRDENETGDGGDANSNRRATDDLADIDDADVEGGDSDEEDEFNTADLFEMAQGTGHSKRQK